MVTKWKDIEIDGISGQCRVAIIKEDKSVLRLFVRRVTNNNTTVSVSRIPADSNISDRWFQKRLGSMLQEIMEIEEGLWD